MADSRGQFAQTRMPLCNDRCSHAVHRQLLLVHRNALGIRHTRARRHGRESGSRSSVSMAFGRGNEPTNEPQVRFSDFASAASAMQALEDYKILMQQPEPDLLKGAVLIARHRHPMVEYQQIKDIIDDLAEQIKPRLPESRYPLKMIHAISEYLYQNRKFRGNQEAFYDPDNSCINCVLEKRLGIPLTLSLLYMEVAARCDFSLHGVNVPGHFLLTPADPDLEFFIDAFEGGKVAFIDDAAATLEKIYGRKVKLDSGFLHRTEQIPARIFFTRMLNNLKGIYAVKKDYDAALQVSKYLRATRPGDIDEVREYGFILWHLKRYNECEDALREYLERAPYDDKDVAKVQKLLNVLRAGPEEASYSDED